MFAAAHGEVRCGSQMRAAAAAQVLMDIVGCLITCATCFLILEQLAHVLPVG